MEMKDSRLIKGAEGIVICNGNIILGMQKEKRWYSLENGERAAIIKTIGGELEREDSNNSRKTIIREFFEEIKGIEEKDIRVSSNPIFTKKINIGDLNPFEKKSKLDMEADFYLLEILTKKQIEPNDLPVLLKIPLQDFMKLEFNKKEGTDKIRNFIINNKEIKYSLPEYYSLMIPKEVKAFIKRIKENEEEFER